MITRELLDRINELARKQRESGLSAEEKAEQHQLRQQYIQYIRSQVESALKDSRIKPKGHNGGCGCSDCKEKH